MNERTTKITDSVDLITYEANFNGSWWCRVQSAKKRDAILIVSNFGDFEDCKTTAGLAITRDSDGPRFELQCSGRARRWCRFAPQIHHEKLGGCVEPH